jgi:hypothetical protein
VKTIEAWFFCPSCGAQLGPVAALVDGHMCSLTRPALGPVRGTVAITQVVFPGAIDVIKQIGGVA